MLYLATSASVRITIEINLFMYIVAFHNDINLYGATYLGE